MNQTEELFVDSMCPHCQRTVSFPDGVAGLVQDCPQCDEILVVPRDKSAMAGKLPLPIMTSRLTLRLPEVADAAQLAVFMCDPEVFRYCEEGLLAPGDVESTIESILTCRLTREPSALWLVIESAGQAIGMSYFTYSSEDRLQGDVSIIVNPAFQRRGYGTEAMRALLGFGFTGINLHRMTASCDSRHTAACRMFEKAGLRREGEFIQNRRVGDEWVNTVSYAMLTSEFDRTLPRRA